MVFQMQVVAFFLMVHTVSTSSASVVSNGPVSGANGGCVSVSEFIMIVVTESFGPRVWDG